MSRMRVLITNDDGILAPGIEALYLAMRDLGEVDVVAPATAQSASGHGISVRTPLLVHRVHVNGVFHGWSVDGRPADCVKLALVKLLEQRPDFVISGINAGANTGVNVLYSGTVAGAIEGALFGVPAMAVSLELSEELDFPAAGRIARRVFEKFVAARPSPGLCLNVNIPALDRGAPRGLRCCRQSSFTMQEQYHQEAHDDGRLLFALDGRFPDEHEPDSDQAAIREGFIAVSPLRFNLTDFDALAAVTAWDWNLSFD